MIRVCVASFRTWVFAMAIVGVLSPHALADEAPVDAGSDEPESPVIPVDELRDLVDGDEAEEEVVRVPDYSAGIRLLEQRRLQNRFVRWRGVASFGAVGAVSGATVGLVALFGHGSGNEYWRPAPYGIGMLSAFGRRHNLYKEPFAQITTSGAWLYSAGTLGATRGLRQSGTRVSVWRGVVGFLATSAGAALLYVEIDPDFDVHRDLTYAALTATGFAFTAAQARTNTRAYRVLTEGRPRRRWGAMGVRGAGLARDAFR